MDRTPFCVTPHVDAVDSLLQVGTRSLTVKQPRVSTTRERASQLRRTGRRHSMSTERERCGRSAPTTPP